jgi:hypothetical protein
MKTTIDFFVPGFSKCGTTTLFKVLTHHPDIFIPDFKEPTFFGTNPSENKIKGFESLYSPSKPNQLKGDCSTFYSSINMEKAASRDMFASNPQAKLIFIARDPVKRIESSFREMHNSAPKFGLNAPYRLEDAFIQLPQLIGDTSYYSRMKTYRDLFGKENVTVIFLEDLQDDPSAVAQHCYDFLDVSKQSFSNEMLPHMNKGEDKLYDSRLFRWMRCNRFIGPRLSKISISKQDTVAKKLGLRKPFRNPIHWSEKAKTLVKERLVPDIEAFLDDLGETNPRWPKYKSFFYPESP